MYKVKRLAMRLGRLDLPTCFSIECQGGSDSNTWLFCEIPTLNRKLMLLHLHTKKKLNLFAFVIQS